MFGGNSNWRGPVWMPVNTLIIRALYHFYQYYGDEFRVECPTGSGQMMTLFQVAYEIGGRLENIFLRDEKGHRAVYGGTEKFQTDPLWRDLALFYEYFHGDNGAGLGASHQTGWTGLIATLIHMREAITPKTLWKLLLRRWLRAPPQKVNDVPAARFARSSHCRRWCGWSAGYRRHLAFRATHGHRPRHSGNGRSSIGSAQFTWPSLV